MTPPCRDFGKSADVDRFDEIGLHIWPTIYLTLRLHGAVLKSRQVWGAGVAGATKRRAGIVAESYAAGAIVSEVARRHEMSPQHLFAWRKAARAGRLPLPVDADPMFVPIVTTIPAMGMAARPMTSGSITIEVAGVVVRTELGVDLRWLANVLRAVKAST